MPNAQFVFTSWPINVVTCLYIYRHIYFIKMLYLLLKFSNLSTLLMENHCHSFEANLTLYVDLSSSLTCVSNIFISALHLLVVKVLKKLTVLKNRYSKKNVLKNIDSLKKQSRSIYIYFILAFRVMILNSNWTKAIYGIGVKLAF